jgi:hypothetical protein
MSRAGLLNLLNLHQSGPRLGMRSSRDPKADCFLLFRHCHAVWAISSYGSDGFLVHWAHLARAQTLLLRSYQQGNLTCWGMGGGEV